MPSDEAAHKSSRPTSIRVPDQLQQAKRPDGNADRQSEPRETRPQDGGVLGQLRTERAHD